MARAVAFFCFGRMVAGWEAPHPLAGGCSPAERATLLDVARAAIRAAVAGRPPPVHDLPARLGVEAGVFVSLHDARGELRGCVGTVVPTAPLGVLVGRMAAASATRDPRFTPLEPSDLDGLTIEISVLAPLARIDAANVDPARHGVCLRLGRQGAVLLPQVAARFGWDRETLFRHLCEKAGLPPHAWRDPGATLEVFTVEPVEDRL